MKWNVVISCFQLYAYGNIEGFNEKIDEYEAMGMPVPSPIWRPSDTMDAMPPALKIELYCGYCR